MIRNWMVCLLALVLAVVLTGCPGAEPPPPEPPMQVETEPPPAEEVEPEPEPPMEDEVEVPWWQDASLEELNRKALDRGWADKIYFDLDQAELKADAREKLARDAEFLKDPDNQNLVVTIEGNCDERGTNEYNLALGDRRANAVKDYLTSLGVSATRMRTLSYGEERPVCTESSESCWWRNRRAQLVLGFAG